MIISLVRLNLLVDDLAIFKLFDLKIRMSVIIIQGQTSLNPDLNFNEELKQLVQSVMFEQLTSL